MHPVFIEIFGRPIYWYGVLTAGGFLAAVVNWTILARKHGRDPAIGSELGIWIMVGGILGARVAFVLANLPAYLEAPMDIIRIDKAGVGEFFLGGGQVFLGQFHNIFAIPETHRTGRTHLDTGRFLALFNQV